MFQFLSLIYEFRYINDAQIKDDEIIVEMNNKFGKNFVDDMERYVKRNAFKKKFGDPI